MECLALRDTITAKEGDAFLVSMRPCGAVRLMQGGPYGS